MNDNVKIPEVFVIPTFLSELRMTSEQEGRIRTRDYQKTIEHALEDRHALLNEVEMQRAQFQGLVDMIDGNNRKTIEFIRQRDRLSDALAANHICLECLGSTEACPACKGTASA